MKDKLPYIEPELKNYGPNFLWQNPETILPEELAKTEKKHTSTFFGSEGRKSPVFRAYELFYNNGKTGFSVTYKEKLPNNLSPEQKKLFTKKEVEEDGQKKNIYIYQYGDKRDHNQEKLDDPPSDPKPKYLIEKPRELKGQTPAELEIADAAEFIKQKNVIFYTGAGISLSEGVWAMPQLRENIGLENVTYEMFSKMDPQEFKIFLNKNEKKFIEKILTDPCVILNAWKRFHQSAFDSPATPAHQALAKIARKKNSAILTENFDHLQEKTGLKPFNMTAPNIQEKILPSWLKDIDAIICIGLSWDDRGFLAWYKKHNPAGKIIAFNQTQPPYLDNDDFIVKGDLQEILPKIAGKI